METISDERAGLFELNSFSTWGTPGAKTVETIDLGEDSQDSVQLMRLSSEWNIHIEAADRY